MPPMHRKMMTSRVVTQHLYSKSLRSIAGKPIRTNAAYRTKRPADSAPAKSTNFSRPKRTHLHFKQSRLVCYRIDMNDSCGTDE